ncbi:hypothetical protein I317_00184 [Kwoniella heveanensis CBS 569]|nr:hypothetical protein I317_00184 [Kwoniella heveanensis CBS 569]
MPTAKPSETLQLLPSFLQVLKSPAPITIPAPTFSGAITHFLAQLDSPYLDDFIEGLLTSTSLWSSKYIAKKDIANAVKLAVPACLLRIEEDVKGLYFPNARQKNRAREWLLNVIRVIENANGHPGEARLYILAGLLVGLDSVKSVDWGKGRRWIEEDLTYSLSNIIEGDLQTSYLREDLNLMCEVLPCIDTARLWALDIDELEDKLQSHLFALVKSEVTLDPLSAEAGVDVATTARALSRTLQVLHSGGPSSRMNAYQAMHRICTRMSAVAEDLEREFHADLSPKLDHASEWLKHKTAFFGFLLVASTMVDILLSSRAASDISLHSSTALPSNVDLSVQILSTLSSFAYLTDSSQGGFEHYHRILYGCLDLISAFSVESDVNPPVNNGRVLADEWLLKKFWRDGEMSDAKAAFVLTAAEELVHHLSSESVAQCLQLAERHVYRPGHQPSFEAAHAFLLALLRSAGESLHTSAPQVAFFDALLPNYLNTITKQAKRGDITSKQFRSAYPVIVESASHRSPASVQTCLSYLSGMPDSHDVRTIRISVTPHLPASNLPTYVEDLAQIILGVAQDSEERLDLSKQAFEMVIRNLGDDVRSIGIEWWIRYRDEFEGRKREVGWLRSRL